MMLRVGLPSGWRMVSTGTQSLKPDNLIKNLFLKKIKEYESKMAGKEDGLIDATPEVNLPCHFISYSGFNLKTSKGKSASPHQLFC